MKNKVTKSQLKKQAKKQLKLKDKEWADAIKDRDKNVCAYCGSNKFVQAAHLFPREIMFFRHDLDNGIALCSKHHKFRPKESEDKSIFSAHFNPLAFFLWFSDNRTEQFTRLIYKWGEYLAK